MLLSRDPRPFWKVALLGDPLHMVFGLKIPNLSLPKVLDCLRKFPDQAESYLGTYQAS